MSCGGYHAFCNQLPVRMQGACRIKDTGSLNLTNDPCALYE